MACSLRLPSARYMTNRNSCEVIADPFDTSQPSTHASQVQFNFSGLLLHATAAALLNVLPVVYCLHYCGRYVYSDYLNPQLFDRTGPYHM